jgi:hypothetical protein
MANKKLRSAAGAAEEQLKAVAEKLQARLAAAEKAAGRFAAKVKERLPSAAEVKAELPAVRDRLEKARSSVARRTSRTRHDGHGLTAVPAAGSVPDDSWTVAELRAEAKRRGMTGYSRKTKAELLAELRG